MADADTVRRQRQQQLDEKRRRLEELKKRRQDKQEQPRASPTHASVSSDLSSTLGDADGASSGAAAKAGGDNLDSYISSLLQTSPLLAAPAGAPAAASQQEPQPPESDESEGAATAAQAPPPPPAEAPPAEAPPPPPPVIVYDKEIQTDLTLSDDGDTGIGEASGGQSSRAKVASDADPAAKAAASAAAARAHDLQNRLNTRRVFGAGGIRTVALNPAEGAVLATAGELSAAAAAAAGGQASSSAAGHAANGSAAAAAAATAAATAAAAIPGISSSAASDIGSPPRVRSDTLAEPRAAATPRRLNEEEKLEILASEGFGDFVARGARLVERVLGESAVFDVLLDYGRDHGAEGSAAAAAAAADQVALALQFHDARRCEDRAATDVHWSPHHVELLLAAYSARGRGMEPVRGGGGSGGGSNDPDGLVLVWSLASQSAPEYVLTSQSPVLCARFHAFDSHLVLGSTYSGQVVVWDVRAKSLPVRRSPLSTSGHTHPVYSMAMQGTAASHTLVTASTDGMVARWNLGQMAQPLEVLHYKQTPPDAKAADEKRPVNVTSFALAHDDQDLVLGSESGDIFVAPVHARSTAGLQDFRGHYGMVTAVDVHPSKGKELQELLLSSSVDWTARLWHLRRPAQPPLTFSTGGYDYVCDAKWSPKHPALFATANTAGEMGLWNLNHSVEAPVVPPVRVSEQTALTRVAWAPDGRRLAAGDAAGILRVYTVADELTTPRPDEEARLENSLRSRGLLQ